MSYGFAKWQNQMPMPSAIHCVHIAISVYGRPSRLRILFCNQSTSMCADDDLLIATAPVIIVFQNDSFQKLENHGIDDFGCV